MARPRIPDEDRRRQRTIRLAPELDAWIESQTGIGARFKDFTHAVEVAVARLRDEEDGAPSRPSRSSTSKK